MTRGISAYLREAIDCYVSDPGVAWLQLGMAQRQIAEKEAEAAKAEETANMLSLEETKKAFKDRLLELDELPEQSVGQPAVLTYEISDASARTYASLLEQQATANFEYLLDVLTWKENQDRARTDPEISREQVLEFWGRDKVLSVKECSDWEQIEREYELARMAEPDFELYLVRRHLDWAEQSSGKVEEDGPVIFRDSIPDHLKLYMYEARWCELLGFDAASASLCGAVLEEALRIKMNVVKFGSLGKAIEKASAEGLLTHVAAESAREVMRLRNFTVHGQKEFVGKPEEAKKASFPITRKLLDTIFASES
jgi:hypothetical protein